MIDVFESHIYKRTYLDTVHFGVRHVSGGSPICAMFRTSDEAREYAEELGPEYETVEVYLTEANRDFGG